MSASDENSLYEGLLALLDEEFPKTCPRCGHTYPNFDTFLHQTTPLSQGSGLMGYDGAERIRQVAMYRNCPCGSTLATFCSDRRDVSPAGLRRRQMFDDLLTQLRSHGVVAVRARAELLAFLRGQRSELLEGLASHSTKLQPHA